MGPGKDYKQPTTEPLFPSSYFPPQPLPTLLLGNFKLSSLHKGLLQKGLPQEVNLSSRPPYKKASLGKAFIKISLKKKSICR